MLKGKYDVLELKYSTIRKYFENVLSHTELKTTALERKPVIELQIGEINDYKKFIKLL